MNKNTNTTMKQNNTTNYSIDLSKIVIFIPAIIVAGYLIYFFLQG